MNQFLNKFGVPIDNYWESTKKERGKLLRDILEYANANRQSFLNDFNQIKFDAEIMALPVIMEALSADTESWGLFYVDLLNDILLAAKQSDKPNDTLTYLQEFFYIEEDTRPFIQEIVNSLYKELDSDNVEVKLACIRILPDFLHNSSILNRSLIIEKLREQLFDKDWRVRVFTFDSLKNEELLPAGYRLSLKDKLIRLTQGKPESISRGRETDFY